MVQLVIGQFLGSSMLYKLVASYLENVRVGDVLNGTTIFLGVISLSFSLRWPTHGPVLFLVMI